MMELSQAETCCVFTFSICINAASVTTEISSLPGGMRVALSVSGIEIYVILMSAILPSETKQCNHQIYASLSQLQSVYSEL